MSNYNPKSLKAEEFISHEEILEWKLRRLRILDS